MKSNLSPRERQDGQVIVLFALFSIILVGVLALAVDVGYLMSERRAAQNAVDAAATAGGVAMLFGEDTAVIRSTARHYAEANGINVGTIDVVPTGDETGGTVEVTVTVEVERFFLGGLYTGDWEVSARAVAEVNNQQDGQYALIALEEPGMHLSGRPMIDIINGSAMSNGDVSRDGNANVFKTDGTIDAVGDVNPNDNWEAPGGFNEGRPTYPDPLGEVVKPTPTGLAVIEASAVEDCDSNSGCTLQPGYYANMTINIKRTATLQPGGMYYFHNTKVQLQNTNSRIEGTGVFLYFTGPSAEFFPKNGEVHLTAPPTSPYEDGHDGMAVWIENCSSMEWGGNTEFYVAGIFYAPCSHVWIHGTPDGELFEGQMIVGSADLDGNGTLRMKYSHYVDTPRRVVYLVE